MKKLLFYLIVIHNTILCYGQVGINIENPHPSALLHMNSSSKGLSIPNINLQSLTDVTTIESPKESLFVFNTNPNLTGKEGLSYWNGSKWVFIFTNKNKYLIENLTKFYAKKDNIGHEFTYNQLSSTNQFYGENTNSSSIGTTINSEWTVINGLTTDIVIDRSINDEVYIVSGMMQADNYTTSGYVSTSIAVFIDNKLASIKPLVMKLDQSCNYREFTLSFISRNLSVGNHNVKYAIRNRGVSLGSGYQLKLTFGKRNPNSSCNYTLNDDETRLSSSVLINQPFDF